MKNIFTILLLTWFMIIGCSDSKTVTKTTNTNNGGVGGKNVTITPLLGASLTLKYTKNGLNETQVLKLNTSPNSNGYVEGDAKIEGGGTLVGLCKTVSETGTPDYFCSTADTNNNWYLFAFNISKNELNGNFAYVLASDYASEGVNSLLKVYTAADSTLLSGSEYLANSNGKGSDDINGSDNNTTDTVTPPSGVAKLSLSQDTTLPSSVHQVYGCYEFLYNDSFNGSYLLKLSSDGSIIYSDEDTAGDTFVGSYSMNDKNIEISSNNFKYYHTTHTIANNSLLLFFEGQLDYYDGNTYLLTCMAVTQGITETFLVETVANCSDHGVTLTFTTGGFVSYTVGTDMYGGSYFMDKSSGEVALYLLNNDPSGVSPVFNVLGRVIDESSLLVKFSDETMEVCSY